MVLLDDGARPGDPRRIDRTGRRPRRRQRNKKICRLLQLRVAPALIIAFIGSAVRNPSRNRKSWLTRYLTGSAPS
jgi:hypothetical protein